MVAAKASDMTLTGGAAHDVRVRALVDVEFLVTPPERVVGRPGSTPPPGGGYGDLFASCNEIGRNAESFLAHYLPDAYGYGSEELLRAARIAIRPQTLTS